MRDYEKKKKSHFPSLNKFLYLTGQEILFTNFLSFFFGVEGAFLYL